MSIPAKASAWLKENNIKTVELLVSDMAGIPRGKVQPASGLKGKKFKLPICIFAQTITGDYYMASDNIADRDMEIKPDFSTLRLAPWAAEPTASVLVDCYDLKGEVLGESPRVVLQRVVELFKSKKWTPVVAPEVEFYLSKNADGPYTDFDVLDLDSDDIDGLVDPYGFEHLHDLGSLFEQLSYYCEIQGIGVGAVTQELGPSQFEVNFDHGDPLKLADDVFHFKRTLKRVAREHGVCASFLAKP
ncbi:MAG: glutamine synthetase, partial [bacterium]